jgi:hypothetical protein
MDPAPHRWLSVIDDRGREMPRARGRIGLTGLEATVYVLVAAWVGLVWSPDYIPSVSAFLGALAVIAILHAASQVFSSPRVRGRTREQGRCGSCGYDLGGIRPEGDGCRVCPECGGAWRGS